VARQPSHACDCNLLPQGPTMSTPRRTTPPQPFPSLAGPRRCRFRPCPDLAPTTRLLLHPTVPPASKVCIASDAILGWGTPGNSRLRGVLQAAQWTSSTRRPPAPSTTSAMPLVRYAASGDSVAALFLLVLTRTPRSAGAQTTPAYTMGAKTSLPNKSVTPGRLLRRAMVGPHAEYGRRPSPCCCAQAHSIHCPRPPPHWQSPSKAAPKTPSRQQCQAQASLCARHV
jgi:hypothetical protein